MNVLAFGASNSRQSINKALATYAATVFKSTYQPDARIDVLDLSDYDMPIYGIDREQSDGIPALAQQFFDKIGAADALIISYAEHNGTYTAAFKNVFDWASRIEAKVFQNKPIVILATSPGKGGASSVLSNAISSAPFFAAEVKGSLSVPSFYDNFDVERGELTNVELIEALQVELAKLA